VLTNDQQLFDDFVFHPFVVCLWERDRAGLAMRSELGKTQDFLIYWVGFFGFIGFLVGLNPNGPRTTRLVDNGVGNFHGD
jgi:hypothetical protein